MLDDLRRLLRNRPFEPFRIVMLEGDSYEIKHPETVMLGPRSAILGIPAPEGLPDISYYHIVNLLHIKRLEPLPQEQAQN
jgi:hypothetical protein